LEEEAKAFSEVGQEAALPREKSKAAPMPVPSDPPPPPLKVVKPVQQLEWDLEVLTQMFNKDTPSEVLL
jgi:hypothetical protein